MCLSMTAGSSLECGRVKQHKHFCLLMWLDNTLYYKLILFKYTPAFIFKYVSQMTVHCLLYCMCCLILRKLWGAASRSDLAAARHELLLTRQASWDKSKLFLKCIFQKKKQNPPHFQAGLVLHLQLLVLADALNLSSLAAAPHSVSVDPASKLTQGGRGGGGGGWLTKTNMVYHLLTLAADLFVYFVIFLFLIIFFPSWIMWPPTELNQISTMN